MTIFLILYDNKIYSGVPPKFTSHQNGGNFWSKIGQRSIIKKKIVKGKLLKTHSNFKIGTVLLVLKKKKIGLSPPKIPFPTEFELIL